MKLTNTFLNWRRVHIRLWIVASLIAASMTVAGSSFAQTTNVPKAGSWAANFRDDALLRLAASDIASMSRHEIDLLTDALAMCNVHALSEDEVRRDQCRLAYERFSVAYENGRPLDKILFALQSTYYLIRPNDRVIPKNDPRHKQIGSDIERIVDVSRFLASAVSNRNRELARTGSQH